MTTAAVPLPTPSNNTHTGAAHIRKALKFIKSKGAVTAEQLVEWDSRNGRRLFTWNNDEAADGYRLYEARLFLNRFRAKFEGMRVRAFIHLRQDEAKGIDEDAYYSVETIAQNSSMRDQVVNDITTRMANLASELKMWKLSVNEQAHLFEQLRQAME